MHLSDLKSFNNQPAFVSSHHYINRTRTATQGMGENENGKVILKAGTVFPSNNGDAEGIVFHDVDLSRGDVPVAVMIEGYVYESRLPQEVSSAAKEALKEIKFEEYNVTEGQ